MVSKYFDFPGIYLRAPKEKEILKRIEMKKRGGEGDKLHKMEVKFFRECFDKNFRRDAKKYGYKCFADPGKAKMEILEILKFLKNDRIE